MAKRSNAASRAKAALRSRRYRARLAAGKRFVSMEIEDAQIEEAVLANALKKDDADDREKVAAFLRKVIDLAIPVHRDA